MEEQGISPSATGSGADRALGAQKGPVTARAIGWGVLAVVILAILVGIVYGLATHPALTTTVRDISIILLALVTLVIGLFLVVLIVQLQSLISLLRNEIKPILDSANQTVNTVRGTTTLVSDTVVTPVVTVASYVAAARQMIRTLTGRPSRRSRNRAQPQEASEPRTERS